MDVYEFINNLATLERDSSEFLQKYNDSIRICLFFFFFKLSRTYIFVCRGSTFRNDLIIMLFIFGVKIFKENRADGSSWKQHNMIFYMITWLDRILPKWTVTSNSSTIFLRIRFPSFLFFFFYLNLLKSLNEVYTAVQKWYTLSTFYFPFSWSNAFVIFEILTAPWKYKFSNESFLDNIRDDLLKIKLVHRVLYDRIVTKIGSGRLVN